MGGVLASRRELQDKGCSWSAASVSLRRGGGGGVTFSACASATPPVRSRPRTRRPAPPPTCMRRCRRLHVAPPTPLTLARVPIACIAGSTGGGRCLHQNEETPEAVGGGGVRTCPLSRGATPITRTFVMKGAYQSYYMRWNTQYRI
jgi:hypothetical protein